MTDYNKQKLRAIDTINKFISEKKYTIEEIAFFTMNLTGFSEKFTSKYIETGLKLGLVSKKGDIIYK